MLIPENLPTAPHGAGLITDFEESFKNCLSLLLINSETSCHENIEDKKTGIEFAIESFVEKAKEVESFFITQRLIHASANTDDLLLEEINDLQNELVRKEELIKRHKDKLSHWQDILTDFSAPPLPNYQPSPTTIDSNLLAQRPCLGSSAGIGLSAPGSSQGMGNSARIMPAGNTTLSGLLSRTTTGTGLLPPQALISPSKLEGPLAFLEKTASNIGHN